MSPPPIIIMPVFTAFIAIEFKRLKSEKKAVKQMYLQITNSNCGCTKYIEFLVKMLILFICSKGVKKTVHTIFFSPLDLMDKITIFTECLNENLKAYQSIT